MFVGKFRRDAVGDICIGHGITFQNSGKCRTCHCGRGGAVIDFFCDGDTVCGKFPFFHTEGRAFRFSGGKGNVIHRSRCGITDREQTVFTGGVGDLLRFHCCGRTGEFECVDQILSCLEVTGSRIIFFCVGSERISELRVQFDHRITVLQFDFLRCHKFTSRIVFTVLTAGLTVQRNAHFRDRSGVCTHDITIGVQQTAFAGLPLREDRSAGQTVVCCRVIVCKCIHAVCRIDPVAAGKIICLEGSVFRADESGKRTFTIHHRTFDHGEGVCAIDRILHHVVEDIVHRNRCGVDGSICFVQHKSRIYFPDHIVIKIGI